MMYFPIHPQNDLDGDLEKNLIDSVPWDYVPYRGNSH